MSEPSYTSIKVVTPTGKSDHKAVIAYTGSPLMTANKSREQLKYRRRSPNQHALFLSYLSSQVDSFLPRYGKLILLSMVTEMMVAGGAVLQLFAFPVKNGVLNRMVG